MAVRFVLGLSPAMLNRGYLADPSRVNFFRAAWSQHRGPASCVPGVAAVEVLKILLAPRQGACAPLGLPVRRLPQPLRENLAAGRQPQPASADRPVHRAPPVARDAPLKPPETLHGQSRNPPQDPRPGPLGPQWRQHPALAFSRSRATTIRRARQRHPVIGASTISNGHASHMAHGAPLEPSAHRRHRRGLASPAGAAWAGFRPSGAPVFDVRPRPGRHRPRPAAALHRVRVVQRRAMRTTPSRRSSGPPWRRRPGPGSTAQFFESSAERKAVAGFLWRSAYLRLICPEATRYKEIIEGAPASARTASPSRRWASIPPRRA